MSPRAKRDEQVHKVNLVDLCSYTRVSDSEGDSDGVSGRDRDTDMDTDIDTVTCFGVTV